MTKPSKPKLPVVVQEDSPERWAEMMEALMEEASAIHTEWKLRFDALTPRQRARGLKAMREAMDFLERTKQEMEKELKTRADRPN